MLKNRHEVLSTLLFNVEITFMVAVQNLEGEIIQLVLGFKQSHFVEDLVATPRCKVIFFLICNDIYFYIYQSTWC
jgi:hypothetical protein